MQFLYKRFFFFVFAFPFLSTAQNSSSFYKNYFQYPLNIPVKLNANFGEMRPNHFHMGLDLFTERRENLPVLSAAEGYVAKIKIEPGGFGNAIYINHPNGLTTLYAHMNSFTPALESYLKQQQYTQEKWEIELLIPANMFPVAKGQFIGYSGNTGASQGPHVHFEIRNTATDECINPLNFNFSIQDEAPPVFYKLALYNKDLASTYEQSPQVVTLKNIKDSFYTKEKIVYTTASRISLAITAEDKISGFNNRFGIYEGLVFDNEKLISRFKIDSIGYDKTRYLNAHIDYRIKAGGGAYWQHLSPLPGMKLNIYKKYNYDGNIDLSDNKIHNIRIEIKDAAGNASNLIFLLQKKGNVSAPAISMKEYLLPNQVNIFENFEIQAYLSDNAVYDAMRINYHAEKSNQGVSNVHWFLNPSLPVHELFSVSIKPTVSLSAASVQKIVMVHTGKRNMVAKATYEKGWFTARFREFGSFQLQIDTVPPTISGLNEYDTNDISRADRIRLVASDNYGIIKKFRAELDGKWLMFKRIGNIFSYTIDEHCPIGKYQLKITLEDEAGNKTVNNFLLIKRDPKDLPPEKKVAKKSKVSKQKKILKKNTKTTPKKK